MKFFDQARLTQAWLAHDQYQLAIALPRPLPAPHQHGDFFFTTDERREMALACAASATARPYKPEQCHRLGHAFQFMGAALLGDKQTSDLALHPRCHHDRTWLCQRLHPRRSIRRIAVNLTRRIDHYRAGFDADARVERWLARTGILAVHLGERALDREGGPRRAFGVVFLRYRITEQCHQPVAQLLGDEGRSFLSAPRTEPDEPNSGIRLPPWVFDGEAFAWPRMKDARHWEPFVCELFHSRSTSLSLFGCGAEAPCARM